MRDVALMLVFLPMLFYAARYTWVGVLLWTWFSLMNPHRMTYAFAYDFPFAALAAGATLVSVIWNRDRLRFSVDATTVALILFTVWIGITTVFAIFPAESFQFLERAFKVLLMSFVAILAIRERKHIEYFIWVNVISLGFYGLKGGLFAMATGGSARVWGPAGSFIQDNNALGLALVVTIPMIYYLWQVSTRRWLRWALMATMLLTAVATLSTQSRGAFLAIACMGLFLGLRSRRRVLSLVGIVLVGGVLVSAMPENWTERMRSIQNYEEDVSAMARLNAWETAINVANDRPTGAGFLIANATVFQAYSPRPEWIFTAHSIYFQALGEHGYIGFLLFVSMGALSFLTAQRIRKRARKIPEARWAGDLAGMIQVSMVGYAVGGAFLSLAYFDLPYNLLVIVVACNYWMLEERWKTEKAGAFGALSAAGAKTAQGAPHALQQT